MATPRVVLPLLNSVMQGQDEEETTNYAKAITHFGHTTEVGEAQYVLC